MDPLGVFVSALLPNELVIRQMVLDVIEEFLVLASVSEGDVGSFAGLMLACG